MTGTHINLDMALTGYLTGPNGELRFIYGLEELAQDALLYGCTLAWGSYVFLSAAQYARMARREFPMTGEIVLPPSLFSAEPEVIRETICEEIRVRSGSAV